MPIQDFSYRCLRLYKMHLNSYGEFHSATSCPESKRSLAEPMRAVLLSASFPDFAHSIPAVKLCSKAYFIGEKDALSTILVIKPLQKRSSYVAVAITVVLLLYMPFLPFRWQLCAFFKTLFSTQSAVH